MAFNTQVQAKQGFLPSINAIGSIGDGNAAAMALRPAPKPAEGTAMHSEAVMLRAGLLNEVAKGVKLCWKEQAGASYSCIS